MHTCWADLLPHYDAHCQLAGLQICAESLAAAIFTSCYSSNNTSPICWGYIYGGGRWRLFFSGASGDDMWACCCCCSAFSLKFPLGGCVLPALRSPRAFHSSHSQLRSICLGGGTITKKEGEYFGADICVCLCACTWLLPFTLWLMLTQTGSLTVFLWDLGSRWPKEELNHFRIVLQS